MPTDRLESVRRAGQGSNSSHWPLARCVLRANLIGTDVADTPLGPPTSMAESAPAVARHADASRCPDGSSRASAATRSATIGPTCRSRSTRSSTSSSSSSRTSIRSRRRSGSTRSTRSSRPPGRSAPASSSIELLKRARQLQVGLPTLTQTRYINTISPEQEPYFPGDEAMELKIRRMIRWNALAMVLRANTKFEGIGGHLSTYASAASLYEVGFNHFFRGTRRGARRPDLLPGPRGARHLRARLPRGPPDRGAPRPLPARGARDRRRPLLATRTRASCRSFWQFPTVSMGLGPLAAIYQARFNRYLAARGIADTSERARVGLPRRRRDGRAGVDRRAEPRRARGPRQPDLRRQLQPPAPRRPGARQRQDHPGAGGRSSAAPAGT